MRVLWHSICNLCQIIFTNSEIIEHLQNRLESEPGDEQLSAELDSRKKLMEDAANRFRPLAIEYNLQNGREEYDPIVIRDTVYCFSSQIVLCRKITPG